MIKRIILFRFHKNLCICKNRINSLKKFNPKIKIYGLYGGNKKDYPKFLKELKGEYLENIYIIPKKDKEWKWKNGDIGLQWWYKKIGKKIDFDVLHLIEWDLLLLDSIKNIYKKIPKTHLGITGLTPLKKVEQKWSWTSRKPEKLSGKNS